MKTLRRMFGKDNRGLSMVELILAVGILAAISTAIGGAMAVSANSYRKGAIETGLQQESQYTAGVIENLLVDATDTVNFDSGTKVLEVKNVDYTHTISMVSTAAGNELRYTKKDTHTGAIVPEGNNVLLAANVVNFQVDTSHFNESRNAQVSIVMSKEGKEISNVYNITSRNHPNSSTATSFAPTVTIEGDSMVTLEPEQTYDLYCSVRSTNTTSEVDITVNGRDDINTTATLVGTSLQVHVGRNEKGSANGGKVNVQISSRAKDLSGVPLATKNVTVNIRRVVDFAKEKTSFSGYGSTPPAPVFELISGMDYMQDAIYEVTAVPYGPNLEKVFGVPYDSGAYEYKNPYGATWEVKLESGAPLNTLATIIDKGEEGTPYVRIKLTRNMDSADKIIATATAKHPEGMIGANKTNKTGAKYDTVKVSVELKKRSNFVVASLRRGDDYFELAENIPWQELKDRFGGDHPERLIRYRPVEVDEHNNIVRQIGTWTDWKSTSDHGTPGGGLVNLVPSDFDLLNPNWAYLCELKEQLADGSGRIVWPIEGVTPEDEYMIRFLVPAVTLEWDYFEVESWWPVHEVRRTTFPSGTDGLSFNDKVTVNKDGMYNFEFTCRAAEVSKFINQYLDINVYWKKDGDMTNLTTGWESKYCEQGYVYHDKLKGAIKFCPRASGLFKIELDWNNGWSETCRNAWGPQQYYKYDDASQKSGKGVFYIYVE